MKGGFFNQVLSFGCAVWKCVPPHRCPGSNTSVVRASGHNGGSPLDSEERNSSQKPKDHHDQELPMKEKVVTVEKCHSCTNGLNKLKDCKGWGTVFRIEKT